jgi:hypothetical protein
MMMSVTTKGYIIDSLGPYLADGSNNDAAITKHVLEDNERVKAFFQEEDVFIVDRGFRDSIEFLNELGLNVEMPSFLDDGERQLSTNQANQSRLVTKSRWIVEAINGRIKRFLYFNNTLINTNIPFLREDFRIVCALLNKYCPSLVKDKSTDEQTAKDMLKMSKKTNDLIRIAKNYPKLNKTNIVQDISTFRFPILSEKFIRTFTFGIYQLKQAKSYTVEHLASHEDYTVELLENEKNLIRVKIPSRHKSQKIYNIFIRFSLRSKQKPIEGWYCDCVAGARNVGSCSHVASVLWYLGVARNDQTKLKPMRSQNFINSCSNSKE